jgi:uncharacterized protein (UPF0333 family)
MNKTSLVITALVLVAATAIGFASIASSHDALAAKTIAKNKCIFSQCNSQSATVKADGDVTVAQVATNNLGSP